MTGSWLGFSTRPGALGIAFILGWPVIRPTPKGCRACALRWGVSKTSAFSGALTSPCGCTARSRAVRCPSQRRCRRELLIGGAWTSGGPRQKCVTWERTACGTTGGMDTGILATARGRCARSSLISRAELWPHSFRGARSTPSFASVRRRSVSPNNGRPAGGKRMNNAGQPVEHLESKRCARPVRQIRGNAAASRGKIPGQDPYARSTVNQTGARSFTVWHGDLGPSRRLTPIANP
jgi:hypothetical protein